MPTIVIEAPNDYDTTKLFAAIGSLVLSGGFRVLKPNEVLMISEVAPAKNGKDKDRRKYSPRGKGQSVCHAIMAHYTPQGGFTSTHAQSWVHQNGYNLNSASPALTALKKGGYIKQPATGKYLFVRPLAPDADPREATKAAT